MKHGANAAMVGEILMKTSMKPPVLSVVSSAVAY
jgi:hypothetical protein